MDHEVDRSSFRLLPSEVVLWHGRSVGGVPRHRGFLIATALAFGIAAVAGLFALLLAVAKLPGAANTALTAGYLFVTGVVLAVVPAYLFGGGEYVLTDRRILLRRGRMRRAMERHAITYGRIHWNPTMPRIGHLELVRAAPFGPLSRRQRIVLHDVETPDVVFARVRGVEPSESAGASDVPLLDRLDPGEAVVWGGHPEGLLLGIREIGTAVAGAGLTVLGILYGQRVGAILLGLEEVGLPVRSAEWLLFFLAVALTTVILIGAGAALLWYGVGRSRRLGRETEYVLTDRRLLIRRGGTELSVDRKRIVDVADTPAGRGLHHVFLVLDAPGSKALAVSGGLGPSLPARDSVPPVLFELREVQSIKDLLATRASRPSLPPLSDAA